MGARGPIPKRSDQRVRRNKDDAPVETVSAIGAVEVPDLGLSDPHPIVVDLWNSLSDSAQRKYYEPSDWAYAKFALHFADKLLKSRQPSAVMVSSVDAMLNQLLVSEGARRRVRLEVERDQNAGAVIDIAAALRERMSRG